MEECQRAPRIPEQYHTGGGGGGGSYFDGKNKSNLDFLHLILNVPPFFNCPFPLPLFRSASPCPTAASLEDLSVEGCGVGRAGGAVFLHPPPRRGTPVRDSHG